MDDKLKSGFILGGRYVYPLEGRINSPQGDVHVRPKVMEVLLCLANESGKVITREALINSVWGHTYGADEALSRCISSLRNNLGDNYKNPRFLETVPKRGYRLIGPIKIVPLDEPHTKPETGADSGIDGNHGVLRDTVRSIAILPFVNVSSDPNQEYFSDGMADELIGTLSRQSGLRVAARTSSFSFKGKSIDIRKIGQQLDVETILEGSVRTEEGNLRILVQLIGAKDGCQIWSESYDRRIEHIFSIQKDIAEHVASTLQVELDQEKTNTLQKASTQDLEAYDYYLKGRDYFWRNLHKYRKFAKQMFSRAIELDANYAKAWAGLADCDSVWYLYHSRSENCKTQATLNSHRAVELAPVLSEAHVSRGLAHVVNEEYEDAIHEFDVAIRLDPNSFEAHFQCGTACFYYADKLSKATDLLERASDIRPDDYRSLAVLVSLYDTREMLSKAKDAAERMLRVSSNHLKLNPDDERAYWEGAFAWWQIGNREKASEWAQTALSLAPELSGVQYNVALLYSKMGYYDKALGCLEQAHSVPKWVLEAEPDLKPLRQHKRFQSLLKMAH